MENLIKSMLFTLDTMAKHTPGSPIHKLWVKRAKLINKELKALGNTDYEGGMK